jgi:aryl-alcohol dehydrogenase-like predicted oxidoreductase
MQYRRLGRTNLRVSEIGHGLWGMSGWADSSERESVRGLQLAVDLGCTFFDSAEAYGNGNSDRLLGELLRANPGKTLVAASKVPPKNFKWPSTPGATLQEVFPRAHVLASVERIRAAMQVDCIDVLQYHVWDDAWCADPSFPETVAELKSRGLIRWFGLSVNRWEPWNGMAAIRTGVVDVVQVIYNIFDQAPEDELFPLCRAMDIGVIARVPLDEGSLGGTLTRETRFPEGDWRSRYFGPENLGPTVERVERLRTSLPPGTSLPEIALRFVLQNPDVSTTIVGMRKESHVRQNIALSDGHPMAGDVLQRLRAHRWDRKPQQWSD